MGEIVLPEPPHRRLVLSLEMGADDLDEVVHALLDLAADLSLDGREERSVTSGGYTSGYDLTLSCNPDMDGDRFREELSAWTEVNRLMRSQTAEAPNA